MNKNRLTLAIAAGLMSVTALAGCDPVSYSPEGYILTYTDKSGNVQHYTAEDLFGSYNKDTTSASTMFESVYKLMVRNYFKDNENGKNAYVSIERGAKNDVENAKEEAKKNADANGTKYKEEWEKTLANNNAIDEDDLLEQFIYKRESKEFENHFYEHNIELLRDGNYDKDTIDPTGANYKGYLKRKVPYHVRHLLVKVSDSGSANYYNAQISKDDAKKLYDVADALANGDRSFGELAKQYSDDTGSANKFGDLGIMDRDTGYVNEFKLGLYAYENLYNVLTKTLASSSEIKIPDAYSSKLSAEIGEIPFGAFEKLNQYRDVTTGLDNSSVNHGDAFYFPRNIVFNKYVNVHNVSVIVPNDTVEDEKVLADTVGSENATYAAKAGFKAVEALGGKKCLTTKEGDPILVVRSGTSGDSGYQGIHFISVIRDGLIQEADGVNLSEYYTTKYPGQEGYPVNGEDPKQTYVNYLSQNVKGWKERAEEVESKVKSFDVDLRKFIFRKFTTELNIEITDAKIKEQIDNYIDRSIAKTNDDNLRSWETTWRTYVESLEQQKSERRKRLPEVCAVTYGEDHTSGANADLWKQGGICGEKVGK